MLRLSHLSGCNSSDKNPPLRNLDDGDDSLSAFAQALGPDELWVTLEGPEFHLLPAVHRGQCAYDLPFFVTLPGPYRLNALVLRGDYAALDEVTYENSSPPLNLDSISGDKLLLQLGSAAPAAQEAMRTAILDASASALRLPACSSLGSAGEGRYVRTVATTLSNTFSPIAPPFIAPYWPEGSRPFAYFVRLNEDYVYLPYACRRPSFNAPRTAERCIQGHTIDLRGDSQTRTLFNHAMKRICGVEEAAMKGIFDDQCVDEGTPGNFFCGKDGGRVCMTWDSMGESTPDDKFDVVATNFGQWPASHFRIPVANYQSLVKDFWKRLDGGDPPRSVQRMLWMETQPLCWTNARDSKGDWRTHHRIMLYEEAARQVLDNLLNVEIVGLWRQSLPLVPLCPDGNHMVTIDNALDAQLWSLLDAVCPGWAADVGGKYERDSTDSSRD